MEIRIVLYGVALAAFMFLIPAAKAAPVTLACGPTSTNRVGNGFVHFDESEGVAGYGMEDILRYDGEATFSETEIRWKADEAKPTQGVYHYTFILSRTTGELRMTTYNPNPQFGGANGTSVHYCALVQKAF